MKNMKYIDIIMAIIIISILFWYFNIRGKCNCITYNKSCTLLEKQIVY